MFFEVLLRMDRLARFEAAAEHVTIVARSERPELFLLRDVLDTTDNSDLRWTVDTPDDLRMVRLLFEELNLGERSVAYREILAAHIRSRARGHQCQRLHVVAAMSLTILFRVDCDKRIGAGHVLRSLARCRAIASAASVRGVRLPPLSPEIETSSEQSGTCPFISWRANPNRTRTAGSCWKSPWCERRLDRLGWLSVYRGVSPGGLSIGAATASRRRFSQRQFLSCRPGREFGAGG